MIAYLNTTTEKKFSHSLVINFNKPNTFIETAKATFVTLPELKSPMGSNTAGFESATAARDLKGAEIDILNWDSLYNMLIK
jgi:hypothetical protein